MFILLSLILLLFIASLLYFKKDMKNPLAFFWLIWFTILFLYIIKLFDINEIRMNTSIVIFVGISAFSGGYLLQSKVRVRGEFEQTSDTQFKRLKFLAIVTVFTSLPFYIPNIIQVLQGSTLEMMKIGLVTGEVASGGIWMQFFVRPFKHIVIAVSAYCIVVKRNQRVTILSGIILSVFDLLGSGSKTSIVYFLACIIIAYITNKNTLLYIKKNKKILMVIAVVIIGYIIYYVGISGIYYYICGCIPLLDQVINNNFYLSDGFTYGFLSFNSIIRLVINFFNIFGVEIHSTLFDRANKYISRFEYTTDIGNNVNYNAMHTLFGDFYADLGIVGVITFSFVFGAFSCYVWKKYKKTKSMWSYIVYCIVIYYIVFSMVRFQMSNTYLGLMLVYSISVMRFILYGKKINIRIFERYYAKI